MRNGVPAKPHYQLTEFARILGVSYSTAKRMACEGALQRIQLRPRGQKVVPHAEVERLFAVVGLGDEQFVHLHAQGGGVVDVEGMLGVDEGGHTTGLLGLGDGMQGQRRFT